MNATETSQKERMLAGLPYLPQDGELLNLHCACQRKVAAYNAAAMLNREEKAALLREILGKCGKQIIIEGPFFCDYGFNIEIGDNFFANYNLTILDVGKVSIGASVLLGPNVAIYAVGHAIDPELRRKGYEFGLPVSIGDNVWIGGSCVINPGVRIGDNAVVGSGSVVTKDVPDNTVAAGNPARAIRKIGPRDREFYFRDRRYDFTFEKTD